MIQQKIQKQVWQMYKGLPRFYFVKDTICVCVGGNLPSALSLTASKLREFREPQRQAGLAEDKGHIFHGDGVSLCPLTPCCA